MIQMAPDDLETLQGALRKGGVYFDTDTVNTFAEWISNDNKDSYQSLTETVNGFREELRSLLLIAEETNSINNLSEDNRAIYYSIKQEGVPIADTLSAIEENTAELIKEEEGATVITKEGRDFSKDRSSLVPG